MNERIKQLAYEAGQGGHSWYNDPNCIQAFAELIVKECAQVCLSQRDPANLNYKPSERFAEAVKQHFGVEE